MTVSKEMMSYKYVMLLLISDLIDEYLNQVGVDYMVYSNHWTGGKWLDKALNIPAILLILL